MTFNRDRLAALTRLIARATQSTSTLPPFDPGKQLDRIDTSEFKLNERFMPKLPSADGKTLAPADFLDAKPAFLRTRGQV